MKRYTSAAYLRIVVDVTLKVLAIACMLAWLSGVAQAGDWRFKFNGVDLADLSARSIPLVLAGAALSYGVHELGHVAMAEAQGHHVTGFDGLPPTIHVDGMTPAIASAGFISQALVGTLLTIVNKQGDLTHGFHLFTAINSAGYTALPSYGDTAALDSSLQVQGAGRLVSAASAAQAAYYLKRSYRAD